MLRYSLTRLLGAIPTLLLVIVLAFFMVHAVPGGPFDSERVLQPEIRQSIEAYYHIDEPLPKQLARYLGNLAQGDLGPSYRLRGYTVNEIIASAFPMSFRVGAIAMLLALVVGVSIGTYAALRRDSFSDRALMTLAITGISVPIIVVAPVLVLLFAVKLQWVPAGWSGGGGWQALVLPVITLALPQVAYIARLTRASMIEVLGSDFIRTARAQGLGTAAIVRYHALKPAMLPVLSYLGPAIAGILTGSVVVEQVFGIPGLGRAFVEGSFNRDYTVVLGIVIFYAALIVLLNLVVDILYGVIDPKVRYR